ncbi:ATP synthase subunit I [Pseudomonas antarctica]|uniref:F1/F0 ATPase, subunit 2 n=1 Tax=Pseudomonas antarctica TaxID=219572 RepID=A0A1H0BUB5_9PSED|nr:ATP synthase subunit I [Pseudomonas antarctica]KAF2406648.1 N-ATPase, AtpR subunit [Pseudomonas antarctica]SDN49196.1 F1/F0 ATPase, subunit 2 [Pseudomonas antarctica]
MIDYGSWALVGMGALLAGGVLGAIFFGGLWWTVRRGASSPTPARWFLGSLLLRTAIVLLGFYAVGAAQPARLGLCMLGFLLARALVMRVTRLSAATKAPPLRGAPPCA